MSDPDDDLELRALFGDEMRRHVTAFVRAPGDIPTRVRALHSMRGAAAMMRLADLAARLGELESATRAGDPDAALSSFPQLDTMLRSAGFEIDGLSRVPHSDRPSRPPDRASNPPRMGDRASLDPEVLEYFFSEGRTRLERLGDAIDLLARPGSRDALDEAFRNVHALKGAASSVGLTSIARGAHALEAAMLALKSRGRDLDPQDLAVLSSARARLAVALSSPATAPPEIEALVAGLRAAGLIREHDLRPLAQLPADRTRESPLSDAIRVPVAAVAGLAERVGEVGFVGDRMALHGAVVREFARLLAEASRVVDDALQRIGPPRPWGAPADALDRLAAVSREVTHASDELDREGERLGRDAETLSTLAGGAREALSRMEASTARWLFDRVQPAAETVARREGKEMIVVRQGDDVEIARGLAERLVEPLVQLVRNAAAHGVEPPARRLARAKPGRATLRLSATVSGDRLRLRVEDDGEGIDRAAVSARAVALGVLTEDEAREPEAVMAALFAPGVSTREHADAAAGRGVGLDLVQREVAHAGGTVTVVSERGKFTRFELEIPMRALAQRMLVVWAAGERIALPLDRVERVVDRADEVAGPVVSLARVTGLSTGEAPGGLIVVVRGAQGAVMGARVDAVDGAREFVVRPLPMLFAGIRPWSAATVDGEGRVTLVLDVERI